MVCAVAWALATCFTSVFATTMDTVMVCFSEDRERHDGSFMRQYYMTSGLKKLLLEDLGGIDVEEEDAEDVEGDSVVRYDTDDDVVADDEGVQVGVDREEVQAQVELDMYARG